MQNYLEYAEFMSLIDGSHRLSLKLATIMATMGYCGLRLAEATHLKVQTVFIGGAIAKTIQLDPSIAKKASAREIIIPAPLADILLRWVVLLTTKRPGCPWLFPGADDTPMTNRNAQIAIRRLGYQILNRHITPHTLRHTFGTLLARSAPIRVVQQALGHKALSSTMIYTHVNRSDVQNAVTELFPRQEAANES